VLHLTCHVIVIRSLSWNVSQSDLSLLVPPKWQRFPTVMQNLQCLSVSSNHVAFCSASLCHQIIYSLQWVHMHLIHRVLLEPPVDMSLYKDMSCLLCIFTLHSHIINSLTHYPHEHASLPDPHMERASILPLFSKSKAHHLSVCMQKILTLFYSYLYHSSRYFW
jgi:hypothetical protein